MTSSVAKIDCRRPASSQARTGFTLVETLVAVAVLVIALGGIGALAATISRNGRGADDLTKATFFAAERISYFRALAARPAFAGNQGSVSGYVAAGGTYFPPPDDPRPGTPDKNRDPAYHNTAINKAPRLLVREYLYDPTETLDFDALTNRTLGERNRSQKTLPGQAYARNEIPITPAEVGGLQVGRVVPNDEDATPPAVANQPDGTIVIPAPRVNDHLRGNPSFSLSDRSIKFVREVWVQVMHPEFAAAALLPGAPRFVAAPPYGVVVTSRVWRRDPRVRAGPITQPGGPENKPPLAELVGCIGLP